MYPAELEIKETTESITSASYLDLLLSIESDGQLRTSLYDKRDDFNFHITNFSFLSCNIPSLPAYGVFISQFIRYARAWSSYERFILRAARLSSKLLGQEYVMERLKFLPQEVLRSIWGSHQTLWSLPLPNVTWHSGTWPYTMTPSIDQTWHQFAKLWPNWTSLPILNFLLNFGGFHRTLQRVRLANRGRLLLRTPGPVPFRTCICSIVETILSWTCHLYGPFEFRTSLCTSNLLHVTTKKVLLPDGQTNGQTDAGQWFLCAAMLHGRHNKYLVRVLTDVRDVQSISDSDELKALKNKYTHRTFYKTPSWSSIYVYNVYI